MRSWPSIKGTLAVVLPLVAAGLPSAAHAERWYGTGEVCIDLDSVHIITSASGARYVTFRQQLCSGSGILLWAVADSDCEKVRGKDAAGVDLYVYDADASKWRTVFEYFNTPQPLDDEHANAGVACNWAHPQFP